VAFGDGAGGDGATLWDRHHGVAVARYEHEDGARVNHVALSDAAGIAVTVGDDMRAKVWASVAAGKT
jgi:hypothetical protein